MTKKITLSLLKVREVAPFHTTEALKMKFNDF